MDGFTVQCPCGSAKPPKVNVDVATFIHCADCDTPIKVECLTCGFAYVRQMPVAFHDSYQMRFSCDRCGRREYSNNFQELAPTVDQLQTARVIDAKHGIRVPWRDKHV